MGVRVQATDFDLARELAALRDGRTDMGAIASFMGTVRDVPLLLEHYPSMSLRVLQDLRAQALARFDLLDVRIVHRHGALQPGDQIVLVLAAARHRHAAIHAVDFVMDTLKSSAPFWKREGGDWVQQRATDLDAAKSWPSFPPGDDAA